MEQIRVDVADRLRAALEDGALSPQQSDRGEALLSRLKSPVRTAILGPRKSGKSSLLNVLAGGEVVPGGAELPTLQLTYGETEETTCVYSDGTRRSFADASLRDMMSRNPIFINMRRDLVALKTVALLEVVMDGTPEQQARALTWASERCDLALWCTSQFDDEEQALWARMPEAQQRHSTLVLTRADSFSSTEAIADRLTELGAVATECFRDIRPISSTRALAAYRDDGTADTDLLRRTGAQALIRSLLEEVERGRMVVRSAIEDLLRDALGPEAAAPLTGTDAMREDLAGGLDLSNLTVRPKPKASPARVAPAEPEAAAPIQEPAPEPDILAPDMPDMPDLAAVAAPEAAPKPVAAPEAAPRPAAAVTPAPKPVDAAPLLSADGRAALESVVVYLADRAAALVEAEEGTPAPEDVVHALREDAEWLTEFLEPPFHRDDAAVSGTRRVTEDVSDLIQLMEMENSDSAAVDAACLMLQIKRDIQGLLAA